MVGSLFGFTRQPTRCRAQNQRNFFDLPYRDGQFLIFPNRNSPSPYDKLSAATIGKNANDSVPQRNRYLSATDKKRPLERTVDICFRLHDKCLTCKRRYAHSCHIPTQNVNRSAPPCMTEGFPKRMLVHFILRRPGLRFVKALPKTRRTPRNHLPPIRIKHPNRHFFATVFT